jgi:phosphatidylinositol kinase/protein kinase (PI-3  family)
MGPGFCLNDKIKVGMIEVVSNSETISNIHEKYGITGAFNDKTIWEYLRKYNQDPQNFEKATETFLRSCAGYCVATYVLG